MLKQSKHKVIDLSSYEVVLATGLKARHAFSGHTFELLEYWVYLRLLNDIDAAILCTAHNPEVILNLARERYTLTAAELGTLSNCLYDGTEVLLAKLPTVIWVDGCSHYSKAATAVAKRHIAFACNNAEDLDRMDLVLGDTRLYDFACDHYVKKLLFDRFKSLTTSPSEPTAMLYCTYQARQLKPNYIRSLPDRFPQFKRFILVTNDTSIQETEHIKVAEPPIRGLFEHFSTYIYSPLKVSWPSHMGVGDCSPRFPAECCHYGKEIIVDSPVNRGLQVRLHDCHDLSQLSLTKDDPLKNFLD